MLGRPTLNNEQALGATVIAIATFNVWNRLDVTTREVAGQEWRTNR